MSLDTDLCYGTLFVFNKDQSLTINEQRERLPIKKYIDKILYCIENYEILILIGETGSGKSTQIPQYLYDNGGWHTKGIIGITQPRQVAAQTLAERVALERGEIVGETVGLASRFVEMCSIKTKIKYMTEGYLLREILSDPLLTSYSVLIIDEVHERNLATDTILGLLKKIMNKRKLKLIICSATIDSQYFQELFKEASIIKSPSTILSVEGRMHHSNIYYLKESCPDYVRQTVTTIMEIHKKEHQGDILAFLTGQEEIFEAIEMLKESILFDQLDILPMYGNLTKHEQLKVFFRPAKDKRKVIISTNISETSVTIPGVVFVIDCGFAKIKWLHNDTWTDSLITLPISKANALQRAGRAGRNRPGKVYRLYTEEEFNNLPDRIPPEICRTDMTPAIIFLKALGVENVLRFNFPSPPPVKNLSLALEKLNALQAIDDSGHLTNPVGYFLAEMPLDINLSKLLHTSIEMGCSEEILVIICMLQFKAIFIQDVSPQNQIKFQIAKRNFEAAEGDLITLLNVYTAFEKSGQSRDFCSKYFLNYKNLQQVSKIKDSLSNLLRKKFAVHLSSCHMNVEILCKCIAGGLFLNAVYYHHSGVYRKFGNKCDIFVHPTSLFYSVPQPQYCVYFELLRTNKTYINYLTPIKVEWIFESAPHYFNKKSF